MFTVSDRDRVRERILAMAAADSRVVAGAVVGSLAYDEGDRWSDLDLMFSVEGPAALADALADWSQSIVGELNAVHLFDLTNGSTVYRVFLLPGCLQLDLSFTPAPDFGAAGPRFRLLFGEAAAKPHHPPPPAHEMFGHAVHHALRSRFCIERGRYLQAEYWISGVRDQALTLACRSRGLETAHARGFDQLPAEVRDSFGDSLVRSLDRDELNRALAAVIAGLLRESAAARDLAASLEDHLRELAAY